MEGELSWAFDGTSSFAGVNAPVTPAQFCGRSWSKFATTKHKLERAYAKYAWRMGWPLTAEEEGV